MFTSDGHFITSFGREGEGFGEERFGVGGFGGVISRGIAVDASGVVYVCDCVCNCILVF